MPVTDYREGFDYSRIADPIPVADTVEVVAAPMFAADQNTDYHMIAVMAEEALVAPTNLNPCRSYYKDFARRKWAHYSWGRNMSAA